MILQIDKHNYSEKDFHLLLTDYPDENSWQFQIGLFLKEWFNDQSFVQVRTSGSTGVPKLIQMSKQTMIASARMTNQFFGLTAASSALLCLPASYIAGKMMLVRAIAGNYKLRAVPPSANPFVDINDKFDFTAITPYQLVQSATELSATGIKQIIVGGSPVTPDIENLSSSWKVALYETFGMTETASHIALRKFNGSDKSKYFQVLQGVEISQDDRNCLVIKAPHLTDEVLITNDIVELHGSNEFQWLGRFDRVINTGGIKVFPEQIERKIQDVVRFPFFISSLPDLSLGQKIILVVEHSGLSDAERLEIFASLSTCLNKYEIPKELYTIPHFVYSSANKILRLDTLKYLQTFVKL